MRDQHIEGMFNALTDLVHSGNCNPHKSEIADAYFGKVAAKISTVVAEVSARLPRMRKMLEQDGFAACLVAYPFYTEFDRQIPATMEDAARCLALGYAKRGEGIHVSVDPENDTLWLRDVEQRIKSCGGGMGTQLARVAREVRRNKLTEATGRGIITGALESVDAQYQTAIGRPMAKQLAQAS